MIRFPSQARVAEVAPRDGLQSFHRWVDTKTKIDLIDRLSEAGFPVIEVTSFTHPKTVPNLKDAEDVVRGIRRQAGVIYRALVPNAKGAERAVRCGRLDELVGLTTASATYTRKNQNMTVEDAAEHAIASFRIADRAGLGFVVGIGMAFWCPYEGLIPDEQTERLVQKFYNAGIRHFTLGGSMGMEDPRHVGRLFGKLIDDAPDASFGYHIHNMSGMIAGSVLAAVDAGATTFEGSICGIGGGVATPHAIGNLPTEDIVQMLNDAGVRCGIETDRAISAARDCAALLGIDLQSAASRYGSRREQLSAHAA